MLKITLITIGKIKEKFYKEAIQEYLKRLTRYCKIEVIELDDEKTIENASFMEEDLIKKKEGQRILNKIKEDAYIITLEIQGSNLDSIQLANKINQISINGKSHITFIIGGSLGLHDEVINKSDYSLSFSKMTFPHQLMRVVLLEQLYRSFRIINKEPYHK